MSSWAYSRGTCQYQNWLDRSSQRNHCHWTDLPSRSWSEGWPEKLLLKDFRNTLLESKKYSLQKSNLSIVLFHICVSLLKNSPSWLSPMASLVDSQIIEILSSASSWNSLVLRVVAQLRLSDKHCNVPATSIWKLNQPSWDHALREQSCESNKGQNKTCWQVSFLILVESGPCWQATEHKGKRGWFYTLYNIQGAGPGACTVSHCESHLWCNVVRFPGPILDYRCIIALTTTHFLKWVGERD